MQKSAMRIGTFTVLATVFILAITQLTFGISDGRALGLQAIDVLVMIWAAREMWTLLTW